MQAYKFAVILKQVLWWPVAFCWLLTYISDSRTVRNLLDHAVTLSGLGPFALDWVALCTVLLHVHENELYAAWQTWVGVTIWTATTTFEMAMQVSWLPKIFAWIEDDVSAAGNFMSMRLLSL